MNSKASRLVAETVAAYVYVFRNMYVTNEVTYSVLIYIYVTYKQRVNYSLCDMCLL
jgi:hypothetical protein